MVVGYEFRYMINIKPYFQLCRTHTSPLETIPAIVGASLASGGVIHLEVGLWGLFGFLYHQTGYGMNSYVDWIKGYDKDDPHKQHFPLNTGNLDPNRTGKFVNILILITFVYGLLLIFSGPALFDEFFPFERSSYLGFGIMITGAISGIAYNTVGKELQWKSLLISYAHSTVFAVPYISLEGEFNLMFISAWIFVFLWVMYQIQIEGDVKDMITDEENFLINLGSRYNNETDKVYFPSYVKVYSHILKLLTAVAGLIMVRSLGGGTSLQAGVFIVTFGGSVFLGRKMLANGDYNRSNRIGLMAQIELVTMFGLLLAAIPTIGAGWAILLFLLSILWVVVFNKIQWGTIIAPDV